MICQWHLCTDRATVEGKFCSRSCKNKFYVDRRRKELKRKSVEYKGNACEICGYSTCAGALVFHHIDSVQKDFKLSSGNTTSWDRVRAELDKCVLLCANCHAEVHEGLVGLPV